VDGAGLPKSPNEAKFPDGSLERATAAAAQALSAKVEPNSNILRITFRHSDPAMAEAFVAALLKSFIDRNLELGSDPRARDFFLQQKRQFDAESERAAADLNAFVARTGTYSIDDQRKLSLDRKNTLAAALASVRAEIADKSKQVDTMSRQLQSIRPVALTAPQIVEQTKRPTSEPPGTATKPWAKDPPLLLVKLYQDTVESFFRLSAELEGLNARRTQQEHELAGIDAELAHISASEAEYNRLRGAVETAQRNSTLIANKSSELQIDDALTAQKFSSIKIVQPPVSPRDAAAPKKPTLLILGALLSALVGVLTATIKHKVLANRKLQPPRRAAVSASNARVSARSDTVRAMTAKLG
jgi:uncharacterized protein involved in exopolysaccharide biosynthesis